MFKTLAFSFAFVALAAAQSPHHPRKLAEELAAKDPFAQCNVIVQWKDAPSETSHQKAVSRGGHVRRRYSRLPFGAYSMPAAAARELADDPDVVYISPDRTVNAELDYTAAAVNAATAWSAGFTGSGIGVALIDSGVSSNTDLKDHSRLVYSEDFTGSGSSSAPDLFGHGEHVAGILAGSGSLSSCSNCTRTLKGIAPGANIINLRVLDQNGSGTDSAVMAAIDRAIQLASTYNIRVINLSLGRPVFESYVNDPLCQAAERAWKAGIVVVVAAGNDGRDNSLGTYGYGTITAPGNDPYVITVGAMKTAGTYARGDDTIASYSSKGPTLIDAVVKPDLVAPGNLVVSLLASKSDTLALQNPGNITPYSYYTHTGNSKPAYTFFQLSGTSMAAPVVSAAAALLLQANPAMTPDQVKARLMLTANKTFPTWSFATDPTTGMSYLSYYDAFTVGAGYVDIAAALASTALAQGTALSPTAVYNSSSGTVGMIPDPSAVWNLNTVWGAQSVFDMRTVWGLNAISPANTVWGVNTVWGANSVWGVNTVWGAGINLNGPAAQSMSSGNAVVPTAASVAEATSLSVPAAGEN